MVLIIANLSVFPPDFWPSFFRALVVSGLSLGMQRVLLPALTQCSFSGWKKALLWVALALPFLTPPLLTAYAYTRPFLHLVRYPWLEELVYMGLVFLRVFPLALLAGILIPRRLSDEARYCQGLTNPGGKGRWHFRWRHLEPVTLVSGMLVFLFAFHEFEMASLLGRPAWTVAIFDAQAQGYALGETWKRLWPLAVLQFVVVLALLALVRRGNEMGSSNSRSQVISWPLWSYVIVAMIVVTVVPFVLVGRDALSGLAQLPTSFSMHREVGESLLVAFVSATLSYLVALRLVAASRSVLIVCLLPGLLGALLLSLSLLSVFQWPAISWLRDRPMPMVLGLVFGMLPLLTLLAALARRREYSEASWSAMLAGRRHLRWTYARGPGLGIWACGFYLAYFEMTVSSVLAPASMTPVMDRLYNLMHYGRDTMLSAYVLVVLVVPFCCLGLAFALGYALTSRRA